MIREDKDGDALPNIMWILAHDTKYVEYNPQWRWLVMVMTKVLIGWQRRRQLTHNCTCTRRCPQWAHWTVRWGQGQLVQDASDFLGLVQLIQDLNKKKQWIQFISWLTCSLELNSKSIAIIINRSLIRPTLILKSKLLGFGLKIILLLIIIIELSCLAVHSRVLLCVLSNRIYIYLLIPCSEAIQAGMDARINNKNNS